MRRPEICWNFFFRRNFWGPVPLDRLHLFFYGLCPSAELHYTNCVPDFCWIFFFFGGTFGGLCPLIACNFFYGLCFFVFRRNSTTQIMHLTSAEKIFFSGTSYSDLWFGGTQHHKMCSGLLLIQWFSLGFLLIFFFGGTQHHKMCAWVLLICMDFRRKFISLVTERPCSIFSHWLVTDPAAMDAMEEDWTEPEFQDTEFKVCPV